MVPAEAVGTENKPKTSLVASLLRAYKGSPGRCCALLTRDTNKGTNNVAVQHRGKMQETARGYHLAASQCHSHASEYLCD